MQLYEFMLASAYNFNLSMYLKTTKGEMAKGISSELSMEKKVSHHHLLLEEKPRVTTVRKEQRKAPGVP